MFELGIWDYLTFDETSLACTYCGQVTLSESAMCPMCQKKKDSIVLFTCRKLLIDNHLDLDTLKEIYQQNQNNNLAEQEQEILQITIKKTLDEFPFALKNHTSHYHKSLLSDGVWFAHLVAYQMISFVRRDHDLIPYELIEDDVYLQAREWVLNFLSQKDSPNQDMVDTVLNLYSIPQSNIDARQIILDMILALEKIGKLKIKRPKGRCLNCDIEIDSREVYCKDCAQVLSEENRSIINSTYVPPIIKKKSNKLHQGMFIKR